MRVLVIEDEVDLARALQSALREEGFACDLALDGVDGLHGALEGAYDLIVLDLMLPGRDGRSILERVRRERRTPVLVLTARDGLQHKVDALDAGADDYLTKPFELAELLARARALIRRAADAPRPVLEIGGLEVDMNARRVIRAGEIVELPAKEYALVEYLALNRGRVVSRTELLEHLYDDTECTTSNVIDVYVSNVRRKLGCGFVRTRRGEGYIVDA